MPLIGPWLRSGATAIGVGPRFCVRSLPFKRVGLYVVASDVAALEDGAVGVPPVGSYAVIATAFFTNHRPLVDSVGCALTYQSGATLLATGVTFANSAVVLDGASASGDALSVVGVWTVTNPPNFIRLWCTAQTPMSMFTAEDVSLVAIPLDQVQTQQGCPSEPCPR